MAPADKSPQTAPTSNEHEPNLAAVASLRVGAEEEDAVVSVVEDVVRDVLEVIRDRELEIISIDNAVTMAVGDISKIYSAVEMRYDPGDMDVHKPNTPLPTTTTTDRTDPIVFYDDREIFVPKHQRASSSASLFPSKPTKSTAIATVSSDLFRGTLGPSPEPQPATIDRWARGWLGSRSAKMRDGDGVSDNGSEAGSRSVRSVRSMLAIIGSTTRGRARAQEEEPAKPFSLGPDVREDQGLPTTNRSGEKRTAGQRTDGGGLGPRGSNGSVNGSHHDRSGSVGGGDGNDAMGTAVKNLGGREWTIDGSGKLLVVDRPRGDAMPGTVVSASYAFRDVVKIPREGAGVGDGGGDDDGEVIGERATRERLVGVDERGVGPGRSSSRGKITLLTSSSCRASGRRTSRRHFGKGVAMSKFFALEPTLQPNLTISVDKPRAGVSVRDGGSVKEGPLWPQNPNHMSRSEYKERQRTINDMNSAHSLGNFTDEDVSTVGLSLGSIQSAPAITGLGLGQNADSRGGERRRGGGDSRGGYDSQRRSARAGTAEPRGSSRGHSLTAFDDVNPLEGGVRVRRTGGAPGKGGEGRGAGFGVSGASGASGGALSPLSVSIAGGEDGWEAASAAGPESAEKGGYEEEDVTDPHLLLVKDPDWGNNTRGSTKKAGRLPKINQVSRERPLTHERPHTHNPRDPRKVPARAQAHASPKSSSSPSQRPLVPCETRRGVVDGAGGDESGGSGGADGSSFPSLLMPLTGWGPAGQSHRLTNSSWVENRAKGLQGVVTLAKPRQILAEGLLR